MSHLSRHLRALGLIADKRGSALVELGLVAPVATVILFGVVSGGMVLDRYMTVQQLARNAASMFSRGTDFSKTANQDLLLESARGLTIDNSSGKGVIILTRVEVSPEGTGNAGKVVIAERHVIGNADYAPSRFGKPNSDLWPHPDRPSPNGEVKDYHEEPSAVATNVPPSLNSLPPAESMFIVEVLHESTHLTFGRVWSQATSSMNAVVYF